MSGLQSNEVQGKCSRTETAPQIALFEVLCMQSFARTSRVTLSAGTIVSFWNTSELQIYGQQILQPNERVRQQNLFQKWLFICIHSYLLKLNPPIIVTHF